MAWSRSMPAHDVITYEAFLSEMDSGMILKFPLSLLLSLSRYSVQLLRSSGSFPVLIQVLCQWLCNNPNYDEVSKWYMGWKSMFPDNLLSQPLIRGSFDPNTNLREHIRVHMYLLFPSFQTNSIKLCPSWTEPLQATGSQKQPISWRHNNKRLRHQQRRQNHRSILSSYQWWFIYYMFLNG